MAVQLLPDKEDRIVLTPYDLISLKDAGIRGGAFAMRELNAKNLVSLSLSDPKKWPPILVTLCTAGYIVIDGYHRWEVAKEQNFDLVAICIPFSNENDIIEAAFRANLKHGLQASSENRSDYAYWLHVTYPDMEQAEIALRVGVTQSTVSKAIARREEDVRRARQGEEEMDEQAQKARLKKSGRAFTRAALRFLKETGDMEDSELVQVIQQVVKSKDKERLARIGRLLADQSSPSPHSTLRQFAGSRHNT